MEIPRLLAAAAGEEKEDLIDVLIKTVSLKTKDKEKDLVNVFLQFDLDQQVITTDIQAYQPGESEKRFYYFGNNPAAAKQIYAVREIGSAIHYWTGRPQGVMQNLLTFLPPGELKESLQKCQDLDLFNEKGLNLEKIAGLEEIISFRQEEKSFYLNQEKVSLEKLFLLWIGGSGAQKIVLVIPTIIEKGKQLVISSHADYVEAVRATLQQEEKSGDSGICHICGQRVNTIQTKSYSSKLSKSSVGKVFVTTTVNYAPLFAKQGHQRNYALCKHCYEKIFAGEKRVMQNFKIKIANEDAVVLFEGIGKPLQVNPLLFLEKTIDFAFNPDKFRVWGKRYQFEVKEEQNIDLFEFHILFYQTDGKSCVIKKTIEDVSNIRFQYVLETFYHISSNFLEQLPHFTIGSLYHMIPIIVNKKGEQLNVGRLLDLYAAIVKGELVQADTIFDYFAEALEKGLNEMRSSMIRNHKNLYQLAFLKTLEQNHTQNRSWGKELFIRQMVLEYLAFIEVLQELGILDKEVFKMSTEVHVPETLPPNLAEKEAFLEEHGFGREARGLFYMGVLMYYIGEAQRVQGHETKPILDKISYGGMNKRDIEEFYLDILAKLRQYVNVLNQKNKVYITLPTLELYRKMVDQYMGNFHMHELTNEKRNVFYIMSGYSSCVMPLRKSSGAADKEEETDVEE